jgi:predicted nucleotidyltransferase
MAAERAGIFKTPAADDPALAEAVRRLVEAYQPECVYFFGSVARGDAGPDSDYGLLIVMADDAPPERRRSRLAYEVAHGTGIAADVLVCTRTHFEDRRSLKASLPGTVLREGQLLHPLATNNFELADVLVGVQHHEKVSVLRVSHVVVDYQPATARTPVPDCLRQQSASDAAGFLGFLDRVNEVLPLNCEVVDIDLRVGRAAHTRRDLPTMPAFQDHALLPLDCSFWLLCSERACGRNEQNQCKNSGLHGPSPIRLVGL